MDVDLYAKADGNRKPWWIVAVHSPKGRDFRIATTATQRDKMAAELLAEHGTQGVTLYYAEGYYNIEG